jgi:hypothetical protein
MQEKSRLINRNFLTWAHSCANRTAFINSKCGRSRSIICNSGSSMEAGIAATAAKPALIADATDDAAVVKHPSRCHALFGLATHSCRLPHEHVTRLRTAGAHTSPMDTGVLQSH